MPIDRLTELLTAFMPAVNGQRIDRLLLASPNPLEVAQLGMMIPAVQRLVSEQHNQPVVQISLLSAETSAWMLSRPEAPPATAIICQDEAALIMQLSKLQFDGAIVFTERFQSPYTIAYLIYLAGIPIRIGQSLEFGGSLLSNLISSIS